METAAEGDPNTAIAATNIAQLTKTVSSPTTLYRPLSILHAKSSQSTLAQVGKQSSLNNRHSQLSDSGAESCDADEQTRLIATPTARSHKYIIIPATAAAAAAAAASSSAATPPAAGTAFRQTISASSLATMATLHRAPLAAPTSWAASASEAAPTPPPSLQRQSPSCNALWRRSVNLPATPAPLSTGAYKPSSTTAAASTPPSTTTTTPHAPNATVTFTIDDCESDNGIDDPPRATEPAISSINVAPNLAPSSSPSGGASAVTIVGGVAVDLRPRNEQHSSMRSVVSAYIPSSPEATAQNPHHTFPFQLSGQQPPAMASYGKDLNSYLFHDHVANQIYSDVTSVRSLASIGIGSTDGRRLVIRRVPHSPNELFSLVHPPSPPPLGDDDDDDDSFMDMSDATANLKPRQQHWGNKMQFVLACIGYSVGLGNVWRFPYMCYKSGGGVFLVPYCIILFVCSIPLLFMELSVGQYTGRGPIGALGQLCPLFKGAGVASVVVSFLMSTYYSVIIGYSIYYFFTSFKPYMPWIDCSNRWNTPDCWVPQRPEANLTSPPTSRTPSEEFFENKVLQISPGIEYPGQMRWELFACLICAWLMVYFATWKSIKSSAKVRYFTATFPFVLIIILMGRAVTLEGADDGLRYFFRPNWSELKNANVWINAASQNFNSLGITFGSMISFASYNKYNNNIVRDTIAVSVVNILTSLLVGVFAFATLGNLALEQNTNVRDVIGDGPGLIFVVYPQAMAKMPYAQLWAVMFFFMLLCLGLNSQFAIVEVVVTSIQDGFPNWIKRHLGYHEIVVLIVCIVSFLFGLPNLIQGGIYFFQLMDHYAASVTIMFLAFCQMIAIAWFYGTGRLSKNIKQMTGKAPSLYFKSCWLLLGPSLLFAIWILSLINYKEPTYHNGRYKYPEWAYGIGWMFASFSLVCIPGYAVINLMRSTGDTFWERIRNTLRPNIYECKICNEHHCEHDYPEQEQFMLAQEMSTVYKPAPQVQPTAPLSFAMSQRPGYNSMQQQQQQQQSTIHHPEFTFQGVDDPTQQQQQQQQTHMNYEPPSTSAGGAAGPR